MQCVRHVRRVALLGALGACTPAHTPQVPHTAGVERLEQTTVALVVVANSDAALYCSGVWVSDSVFLTAEHCLADIPDGGRVTYSLRDDVLVAAGDEIEAVRWGTVAGRDVPHDLALVRTRLAPAHPYAPLGAPPAVGQWVQTEGHPLGMWWSYSAGTVSAIRVDDEIGWVIQADAPISPGNSGGGLFDADGGLIGVCHGYMPRGENVNLYIDQRTIAVFLREHGL